MHSLRNYSQASIPVHIHKEHLCRCRTLSELAEDMCLLSCGEPLPDNSFNSGKKKKKDMEENVEYGRLCVFRGESSVAYTKIAVCLSLSLNLNKRKSCFISALVMNTQLCRAQTPLYFHICNCFYSNSCILLSI